MADRYGDFMAVAFEDRRRDRHRRQLAAQQRMRWDHLWLYRLIADKSLQLKHNPR